MVLINCEDEGENDSHRHTLQEKLRLNLNWELYDYFDAGHHILGSDDRYKTQF